MPSLLFVSCFYPQNSADTHGSFIRGSLDEIREAFDGDVTECVRSEKNILSLIKFWYLLWKLLGKNNFEIIYISFPTISALPLLLRRNVTSRIVARWHGGDYLWNSEYTFFQNLFHFIARFLLIRRIDFHIWPAESFALEGAFREQRSSFREFGFWPSKGVESTAFFPDFSPLAPSVDRELVVGFAGRNVPQKGLSVLTAALRELDVNWRLKVAGEVGSNEYCVSNSRGVIEFCGQLNSLEMGDFYRSLDCFIFPTLRSCESFGNVVLEALACGTPVISSTFSHGANSLIIDEQNGYLYDGSQTQLLDKLRTFGALDADACLEMAENAVEQARTMSRASNVEKLRKCFNSG